MSSSSGRKRTRIHLKPRLLAGLALIFFLVCSWLLWKVLADHVARLEQAKNQSETLTRSLTSHVDFTLRQVETTLKAVSRSWRTLPAGQRDYQESVLQMLHQQAGQANEAFHLAFLDANGRVLASASPLLPAGTQHKDEEFFKQSAKVGSEIFVAPPQLLAGDGRLLVVGLKVHDDAGTPLGLAVATLEVARLQAFFDLARPEEDVVMALVHGSGRMIVRSPVQDQVFGRETSGGELVRGQINLAVYGNFESSSELDTLPRIYAYRTVANLPLIVEVGVPRRPVDQGLFTDALVALLGGGLMLALITLGSRSMLHAYRRLERSEQRLVALTSNAPNVIALLDTDGKIRYVNRSGFGLDPRHSIDTPMIEWVPQDIRPRYVEALRNVFELGQNDEFEGTGLNASGGHAWYRTRLAPVLDGDQVVRAVLILDDITARVAAEAEILWLNEELERLVKERTVELKSARGELEAFGDSVSHDLRAPLCTIEEARRVLEHEFGTWLDETGRASLQTIATACRRMDQLIVALMELSEYARRDLKRQKIDLSAMVKEAAAELERQWQPRRLVWAITEGLEVQADAPLLRLLCRDLLDNAIKFSAECDPAHIEFGLMPAAALGRKEFFIRDDGAGFSMPGDGKLFRMFQRLHPEGLYPGLGVGLARSHTIVLRHGGEIRLESEPGKGTTVFFTL